jgi:hypothetical protein
MNTCAALWRPAQYTGGGRDGESLSVEPAQYTGGGRGEALSVTVLRCGGLLSIQAAVGVVSHCL